MLNKIQNRRGGFTLVEIMIVVAIIALLAAIAVPSALRARKRSQATSTLQTLRILDAACDQWAIENGQSAGSTVSMTTLSAYVKKGSKLYTDLLGTTPGIASAGAYDAIGNTVTQPVVDTAPQLSTVSYNALSDVAPTAFWGPYYTAGS